MTDKLRFEILDDLRFIRKNIRLDNRNQAIKKTMKLIDKVQQYTLVE